jgi:hypothetical protein
MAFLLIGTIVGLARCDASQSLSNFIPTPGIVSFATIAAASTEGIAPLAYNVWYDRDP